MLLDPWVPLEQDVVAAMLNLANLQAGELHLDLGSGDGRFLVAAQSRGAISIGYEINAELVAQSLAQGLTVKQMDCFDAAADIRQADVITAWFTVEPYASDLLKLLRRSMKKNARLVFLYTSSVEGWRQPNGTFLVTDRSVPSTGWVPVSGQIVLENHFYLYQA